MPGTELTLPGLRQHSLQGDAVVARLFEPLGVRTLFTPSGVQLSSGAATCSHFSHDCTECPDIIQTLAVTLCLKDIPFRITGAHTLRVKETDRIAALQAELGKLGYPLQEPVAGTLEWTGEHTSPNSNSIETYQDHRMALPLPLLPSGFPDFASKTRGL
jgi:3-phosphoshikimate 1-carboxyvinyltransferase